MEQIYRRSTWRHQSALTSQQQQYSTLHAALLKVNQTGKTQAHGHMVTFVQLVILHRTLNSSFHSCQYFGQTLNQTLLFRSNTLPSRRTLKNSRLVCKKDDVHVCVMCLRAIMNYQVCRLERTYSVRIRSTFGDQTTSCEIESFPLHFLCTQYGFNMVMSHPHAVNEIALSLNNKNPR